MAITWQHDLDKALAEAQREGEKNKEEAVLLDFTAAPM
jgi:hypothetical protein